MSTPLMLNFCVCAQIKVIGLIRVLENISLKSVKTLSTLVLDNISFKSLTRLFTLVRNNMLKKKPATAGYSDSGQHFFEISDTSYCKKQDLKQR